MFSCTLVFEQTDMFKGKSTTMYVFCRGFPSIQISDAKNIKQTTNFVLLKYGWKIYKLQCKHQQNQLQVLLNNQSN